MRAGESSKTAEQNALLRSLERGGTVDGRLDDALAPRFLGWKLKLVDGLAQTRAGRRVVLQVIDRRWPGVRTSVVARTRFIDEAVAAVLPECRQVVLLGAGFDTRAYRLFEESPAVVFEVDHPATQRRKRQLLASAGISDEHVRYVATDFRMDRLDAELRTVGFDSDLPTIVVWEGVTNYLDQASVDRTIRWCGSAAAGSVVIFTYVDRLLIESPERFHGAQRSLATTRRSGEQVVFGMDPSTLTAHLTDLGLRLDSDVGADDYRLAYYGEQARSIRGHEFYRVVQATVGAPAGPEGPARRRGTTGAV